MSSWIIIAIALGYLGVLFLLAHLIDRGAKANKHYIKYKWIYALSIPVYCTAWTYFGSVGKATTDGWEFLTIYVGPILSMPLWWIVVRKLIRICESQRISTLPDLISSRYGKSVLISVLASVFIIVGIIPYISIQLKSIINSYEILAFGSQTDHSISTIFLQDTAFYLVIILALFIIIFVFRSIETTDKHYGMMGAIAIDSVIKLMAFLAVGVFVTYGLFDGFGDILNQSESSIKQSFEQVSDDRSFDWFIMVLLSMSAVILLPRQFQVTVAENTNESHIKTATWVFPLYLLLINIFVIPIALGGKILLPSNIDPDSYVLAMPLINGSEGLALFTFIGGFSAATGMIIVSTTALSLIATNNIFVPLLLKRVDNKQLYASLPLRSRRLAVFIILFLAYIYYKVVADQFSIVSIGLISFAAMIQFLPAIVGALFWKDANKKGVLAGLIAGFIIWGYTLVVPTMAEVGWVEPSLMENGFLGISSLKPHSLFGSAMSPITHGTFWSLFINASLFFGISILTDQSAKDRNMAELFVDIFKKSGQDDTVVWKGRLVQKELIKLSENLLGKIRTEESIKFYEKRYGTLNEKRVDPQFVNFIERMMAGAIGSASSRVLISSIAQEEEIEITDVIELLRETSEISSLNAALTLKSDELSKRTTELETANERLRNLDQEKDDFISTVTHELRTPLTSIKAFVEIVQDNPEIEERDEFLTTINEEIDRMTRLINQVLEMEKLESGAVTIDKHEIIPHEIVEDSIASMQHLLKSKNIKLLRDFPEELQATPVTGDKDRLQQVFMNLVSNSIKHAANEDPTIKVEAQLLDGKLAISIIDNGKGIKKENLSQIFDKFFQARDQTLKKPKGTGLGLSITKKIVELHEGSIEVESTWEEGARFTVKLPID